MVVVLPGSSKMGPRSRAKPRSGTSLSRLGDCAVFWITTQWRGSFLTTGSDSQQAKQQTSKLCGLMCCGSIMISVHMLGGSQKWGWGIAIEAMESAPPTPNHTELVMLMRKAASNLKKCPLFGNTVVNVSASTIATGSTHDPQWQWPFPH